MTEDRDFKDLVRRRAAKTGESYQAARRRLERRAETSDAVASIEAIFRLPAGIVLGCTVRRGTLHRGDRVAVVDDGGIVVHEGTIQSIRNYKLDITEAGTGLQCGLLLDPPYGGSLGGEVVVMAAAPSASR